MRTSTRHALLIIALVVSTVAQAVADSNGKTGSSATGCGGCHGGQAGAATVTLEGPRTVLTGQTKTYTVVVAHATQAAAGFNAAFRRNNANTGTLQALTNCQVANAEVTHTAPTVMAGGAARFEFRWTAPATTGQVTFTAAGNAVNNDGRATDADDWSLSGAIQIDVNGGSITQPSAGASFCTGQQMAITWTQTGLGSIRLELSKDGFQTQTVVTTIQASVQAFDYTIPATLEPGTYSLRIVDAASGDPVATVQSITINAGPAFTLQPEPTFVCAGKPLKLTVSATGANLQYRWRKNGQDIAGGTNPMLTINTVTTAEAGTYDCVVFGCNTNVTSNAVQVTVGVKPEITSQPTAATVCEGGKVTFSVSATGTDITYTWKKNNGIVPGGNEPILTIDAATLFDEGDYTCLVEGACGPSATSTLVKLSVIEKPFVRTEPVDKNLKEGDTLSLTVVAAGELLKYEWSKDGVVIPNEESATYRKLKITKADSGVYHCRIYNQCGTVETRRALVKITSVSGPGRFVLSLPSITFETVPACSIIDTVVTGLLVNDGGSPVTITSVSAEPIANIEVVGLTAPFALDVNERRDVRMRITPKKIGPIDASVQFFASSGNQTFKVNGEAVSGFAMADDTLVFPAGVASAKKCASSVPLPCSVTVISRIRISGLGSASWKQATDIALPYTFKQGERVELCFESIAETGDDALVTITTDVGDATLVLARRVISSVDEQETSSSLQVYPNPMSDDLFVKTSNDEAVQCQILTITGSTVATLRGVGEVVWSRRDSSGEIVPSGLYLLVVTSTSGRSVHKVVVR